MQASASLGKSVDHPVGETEQAELLGGRRIGGEPIRVVRVALRGAHLVRITVAPDRAFTQQPVRGEPRATEQKGRPPRVGEEQCGAREPADHHDQTAGDEIHGDGKRRAGHAEVEVARHGEFGGELRVFKVGHARRADASFSEPVVEPRGGTVAEVGADRLVDWVEHLEQKENGANQRERAGQTACALDRGNEDAHGNGEHRGQQAPQDERDPPRHGEAGVSLRQNAKELPFVALTQTPKHPSFLLASHRAGRSATQPDRTAQAVRTM